MDLVEPEVRDPHDDVRAGTRRLLVVVAVLTLLAVNQLFVLAGVAERFWAWTIHTEMTAAFIGAGSAAGFVLSVVGLREERWSRIRMATLRALVAAAARTAATAHVWREGRRRLDRH